MDDVFTEILAFMMVVGGLYGFYLLVRDLWERFRG